MIDAMWREYPGIGLRLEIGNSRLIEERIGANELNRGVVGGHGIRPKERSLAAGLVDELALVASPRHPWARRPAILPARLAEERLLVREDGSATRQVTERALQAAGVMLRRTMQLGHTEAIEQAVMAGLGVAFVSRYAVRGEVATRRLAVVPVRGLKIQRHFHVIHNETRGLAASARAFIALLERSGRTSAA